MVVDKRAVKGRLKLFVRPQPCDATPVLGASAFHFNEAEPTVTRIDECACTAAVVRAINRCI